MDTDDRMSMRNNLLSLEDAAFNSTSPMAKMAKMLGKSAVYGAKNKLDAARAEDPAMYDRAMEKQSRLASENFSNVRDFHRQALLRNLGLTGKASANDTSTEERRNIAGDTYKKGGKVKATASSRGDGIAKRGKTRGRMV